MASLYGVSVKKVHCGKDHEGCAMYSGDLYFNNKKLGSFRQDYMSGYYNFDFNTSVLDSAVQAFKKSLLVEDRYRDIINLDIFVEKVIGLSEDEKNYKKGLKNGYKTFAVQEHGYRCGFWCNETSLEAVKGLKLYRDIENGGNINVYFDLADFLVA